MRRPIGAQGLLPVLRMYARQELHAGIVSTITLCFTATICAKDLFRTNTHSNYMNSSPSHSRPLNGGQLVVRALETHGVQRIFCVPGESYLPVLDALYNSDIDTVVCRHEGGASMMAEATGKLQGTPGVCFVTRGPGATNACAGLHVAQQDSTPMILFIGQIGTHLREREAFQEIDYRRFLGACVKWVAEIDDVSRIDEYISRAFSTATSGRPGPVALALPETTLSALSQSPAPRPYLPVQAHPGMSSIMQLVSLFKQAEHPLLILGGSCWDETAVGRIQAFTEQWQLPVSVSLRRQMLFDHEHPNYAGDVGIGVNPKLAQRVRDSDLVVLFGGRFSEMPSQDYTLLDVPRPKQTLVHIYPGAEELGRVYHASLAINASPVNMLELLCVQTIPAASAARADYVKSCHEDYINWSSERVVTPGDVQMSSVMSTLQEQVPVDTIVTNGAGNYASWIHRYWRFRSYGSQLAPTSGSMGYGLPAAIAAKLNHPERCVVAFAGDGCLQMTLQELGTAVQHEANIIVIVVDNGMYGTIRMHQEKHFPGRVSATQLLNPDFAALAAAYGVQSFTVLQTDQFADCLEQALTCNKPALIHIKTSPEAITPTTTLAAIRAAAQAQQQSSNQ